MDILLKEMLEQFYKGENAGKIWKNFYETICKNLSSDNIEELSRRFFSVTL